MSYEGVKSYLHSDYIDYQAIFCQLCFMGSHKDFKSSNNFF